MIQRRPTVAFIIGLLTAVNVSGQGLVPGTIASPPPEPAGAKEIALQETDNAVALLPMSQDAVVRPALEEDLARVEAEGGEKEPAIARLQKLLNTHTHRLATPARSRLSFCDCIRIGTRCGAISASRKSSPSPCRRKRNRKLCLPS